MHVPRFIKWLPLPAGALALAAFCTMVREAPERRVKWTPPVRVARAPLRAVAAELTPLPPAERGAALERLLRGARRITAEDAEWFLELRSRAGAEGWEVTTAQWHQLLERWASAQPQEAAEFIEKHGMLAPPAPDAMPVLKAWARGDAASILNWVNAGGDGRKAWWNHARDTFAQTWVEHDKAAAWAWVDAGGSDGMESSIVGLVFGQASAESIEAWLTLHGGEDARISPAARDEGVQMLAQLHVKNGGAEAAMSWADALRRPDELASAAQALVPALTASEPDKAVAWLDSLASRQHAQPWLAREAMIKWAATDPVAAGEWLNVHRDSPAAPAFIEAYAVSVASDDPAAARQWIAQLPETQETPVPQANELTWPQPRVLHDRRGLEHLVSLAEISAIALDEPERAVALAAALPGNAAPGLMNYHITLVRAAPGEPPVPRLTPISPFV